MRKRRVFVAILVPPDVRREIVRWQKTHAQLDVRWKKPTNLHVTLIGPWHAGRAEIEAAKRALAKAAEDARSFSLDICRVRWGPPSMKRRLIWSAGKTPKAFGALKRSIERALLADPRTGVHKRDKFPTIAHITIANFTPSRKRRLPPLNERVDWGFEIREFAFIESTRMPPTTKYRIIERFDFS
ncbi:MAG: RNA 2',3'-cyclic phosphodiesterase [Candidatus Niyogibacteria bacterium]|nr:RNA 2',3'-cyclic phosphodiesterase [Candidatus Niyogibacteria bacterium]